MILNSDTTDFYSYKERMDEVSEAYRFQQTLKTQAEYTKYVKTSGVEVGMSDSLLNIQSTPAEDRIGG